MITKQLNWSFLQTTLNVDTSEDIKLDVSYDLRLVEGKEQLQEEFGAATSYLEAHEDGFCSKRACEEGLIGDERFSKVLNQVCYLDITLKADKAMVMPKTSLDIRLPIDNIQSLWLPSIQTPGKNYRPKGMLEYYVNLTTHICNLAPMGAFYSAEGLNKLSFALSDCKNVIKITGGAYEEQECARLTFDMFDVPCAPMQEYKLSLRLDTSLVPVFAAVQNISRYYERELKLDVMNVPEAALEPVYSTWYAFLQNLQQDEIEDQCRLASQCGCKTVIVDDGWQTDDSNRGYAFCGDWQLSTRRFPAMKEHVKRVHEMGMKYMVWFSVPFIGGKSQNAADYKDYCLCYNPRWGAYVLDPRYKKVRDFLVNTFSNTVREYDLDGLKLDFIDEFDMRQADEKALAFDDKRDTQSLPDAVDMLMSEIRVALSAIKPDILIEFRQNYVGPMIRKFGNMFRAHDCPNDTLMNRMTTTDVRAMALSTAVHSDMFIWSPSESVQSASLNFIHTLFAVPQVSCNFKHLNESHIAMVKHWLSFYQEHRDLLMNGQMSAEHPELMYSILSTVKGDKQLTIVGNDQRLCLFENDQVKNLTLVNGAMLTSLIVKASKGQQIKLAATTYDCLGKEQGSEELLLTDKVMEINIPKSGYIKFKRL